MISKGHAPGNLRNQQLNGGAPDGWRRVTPTVVPCQTVEPQEIVLYALISTWHDADVIAATVRNCFEQGCDKVYLLDNNSPDETRWKALEAGALVASVYETEKYDDDLRCRLQNETIQAITTLEKLPTLWWLAIDADEFPAVPRETLKECLSKLPTHIKTVGCDFIDLYPTEGRVYEPGKHPAECMTHGVWRRGGVKRYCECGHWKHPLVKYENGVYDAGFFRGNHGIAVPPGDWLRHRINEPESDVICFHAPIRAPEETYKRLSALCDTGRNEWDDQVTNHQGAIKRRRSLDAIYAGRWREVEHPHTQIFGRDVTGLALYPWRTLAPGLDAAALSPQLWSHPSVERTGSHPEAAIL